MLLFTRYCCLGKRTPIAVRFSTVGGESGSADTVRDPRGFAVKLYTEEGMVPMGLGREQHAYILHTVCVLLYPMLFLSVVTSCCCCCCCCLQDSNVPTGMRG